MSSPTAPESRDYQVLARAYRPQNFADLIGQEAMVRTLTNAFERGRIPHAYMLTGVRGVGKTTTARLLARALNYEDDNGRAPRIDLTTPGRHCAQIAASRHPDVLEMDAASNTGIDNMRDILDNARYAPQDAAYKVYIIDEVHMLSNAAFNALLKTLEEPPPHVKFVFATTEIRKVPVTILSRCQRFDLRRIEPDVLLAHLQKVLAQEGIGGIPEDGLRLIVRAAEGSVRDALSLLDQAIVQGDNVTVGTIRDMMGLADRTRTLDLFGLVLSGREAEALTLYDGLHADGADPVAVIHDLLDHCYHVTRARTLGEAARFDEAADLVARIRAFADETNTGHLTRLWQMLLKADQEVRQASDGHDALAMAVLRLAHAAHVPTPEDAARLLQGGAPAGSVQATSGASSASQAPSPATGGGVSAQARGGITSGSGGEAPVMRASGGGAAALRLVDSAPEALAAAETVAEDAAEEAAFDPLETPGDWEPDLPVSTASEGVPATLEAISALAASQRDLNMKYDIDHFVAPVRIAPGTLEFRPGPGAPEDLQARLARRLRDWTGQNWFVTVSRAEAGETLAEQRQRAAAEAFARAGRDPVVRAVLDAFPGAVIESVTPPADAATPTEDQDT